GVPTPVVRPKWIIYAGTTANTKVPIGKGPVRITAHVAATDEIPAGVILSSGGFNRGGTSLFVRDGRLHYVLHDGYQETVLQSDKPFTSAAHTIRIDFTEDKVALYLDGDRVAEQQISPEDTYLNSFY